MAGDPNVELPSLSSCTHLDKSKTSPRLQKQQHQGQRYRTAARRYCFFFFHSSQTNMGKKNEKKDSGRPRKGVLLATIARTPKGLQTYAKRTLFFVYTTYYVRKHSHHWERQRVITNKLVTETRAHGGKWRHKLEGGKTWPLAVAAAAFEEWGGCYATERGRQKQTTTTTTLIRSTW